VENKVILLDTSILIDYYRKKDKSKSVLFQLERDHQRFAVSVITQFEIYKGAGDDKIQFWNDFFQNIDILPFNSETAWIASEVDRDLKKISKQIDLADLFIAATAISNDIPCATLNKKHFERIEKLKLIS
jgi:predicted nucleic acid-binding protein